MIEQFYETIAVTAIVPRVTTAFLQPQFPQLFIVVPKSSFGLTIYEVEKAPAWAFDAWCCAISGVIFDLVLVARTLHIDRARWEIHERWQIINELAVSLGERGVRLPLYSDRIEARKALCAMEGM